MTERDRQRAIQLKLARLEARRVGRIPTGFPTLDQALEGGLPRGLITELAGGPSCGKTTFALSMVAHAQENGLSAAWIDAEHVFDPAYAARLGVSLERLPVARADTAEESLEIARRLAESGAIDLLALDSAAALTPAHRARDWNRRKRTGLARRAFSPPDFAVWPSRRPEQKRPFLF